LLIMGRLLAMVGGGHGQAVDEVLLVNSEPGTGGLEQNHCG